MPAPNITTLPTAPSRSRPSTFSTEADAFLGALPDFGDEANALGDYLDTLAATVDTDATAAATSASNAATSETNAANSASAASTSETNAATSETNAAASATAAAASYDSFDDRYLGPKASAPSTDNDGDPLVEGALYWNTTEGKLYIWNGSAWDQAALNVNDTNALINTNNLSDLSSVPTARTNLGLGDAATATIGVDVQAYDAGLTDIAGLTPTDGNFIVGNGTNWVVETGDTVLASIGITATSTELNILDGATLTTTELNYVDGVTSAIQTQLDAKMTPSYTGDVDITGELIADSYNETYVSLSGTTPTVNCESGNVFALSTTGNTTFTFSNPPASGTAYGFTLRLTSGGAHTITYPASVDWAGGTAPDAPASGETDVLVFITVDGGTTWYGFLAGDALA